MNNYSSMGKQIALFLSKFPRTKSYLKKLFQRLNFIIHNKSHDHYIKYEINKISINNEKSFFGYYDKSPINQTNNYLIFHSTDDTTQNKPNATKPIKIILFDFIKYEFVKNFPTSTYNWQQGARLQWIDENHFIFNDYNANKDCYISKIVDSDLGEIVRIIDYPIYDSYNNIALSLNFDRLHALRPDYGYSNRQTKIDITDNNNDGIFLVDLKNNTSQLIISLQAIIAMHRKNHIMENAKHWFNHIMISPDGDKFVFLHRWLVGNRRFDALFLSDIYGKNIQCLAADDMVSHFCWYGNEKIISFLRDKSIGDKYYLIDTKTGKKEIIGEGIIDKLGDGHPSVFKNQLLFDTYPNKARMKELYLFNLDNNNLIKLGEFFESFKFYGETRCDLHPRWSYDGSYISFDSVHDGVRNTYILENTNGNDIE